MLKNVLKVKVSRGLLPIGEYNCGQELIVKEDMDIHLEISTIETEIN